jgi:hypothetical protein
MNSLFGRILGATLVCVAFYALTQRLLGPVVWLFLAVVIGVAFSRIVIDLAADLGWRARQQQLKSLSGTHYQFQSNTIHVFEDDDCCRWLATDEIRRIVGGLVSDSLLAAKFPNGYQSRGKAGRGYLRDDALVAHLADLQDAQAIKFKNWVEHSIALPSRTVRKRKGIQIADAAPSQPPGTMASNSDKGTGRPNR